MNVDELKIELEKVIAKKKESIRDAGDWYSEQSREARELSIRIKIAKLDGTSEDEVQKLKNKLEMARYVGD